MPSGSVTCLGVKPRFLAYAGYDISRSVPMYLFPNAFSQLRSLGVLRGIGKVSLMLPDSHVLHQGPQYRNLDTGYVSRRSRSSKGGREKGNEANTHWSGLVPMLSLRICEMTNQREGLRRQMLLFRTERAGVSRQP